MIEGSWTVRKAISSTGWGLEGGRHASTAERGARSFEPVINTRADLERLEIPRISHDEEETARRGETAQANDCVLEMILKDTHTCEHQPQFSTGGPGSPARRWIGSWLEADDLYDRRLPPVTAPLDDRPHRFARGLKPQPLKVGAKVVEPHQEFL